MNDLFAWVGIFTIFAIIAFIQLASITYLFC